MLNIYHKLSTSKLIVGTRAAVAVKKKMFLKIIPWILLHATFYSSVWSSLWTGMKAKPWF